MKLYLISQSVKRGYDTYDSAVVAAKNEEEARSIHPCRFKSKGVWCDNPEDIEVQYLGEAAEDLTVSGIILGSFNAG